jgi:hypothetical protein
MCGKNVKREGTLHFLTMSTTDMVHEQFPPKLARQRLSKHFPAAMNTQAAIELLDAVFSVRSVSYQVLKESRQLFLPARVSSRQVPILVEEEAPFQYTKILERRNMW